MIALRAVRELSEPERQRRDQIIGRMLVEFPPGTPVPNGWIGPGEPPAWYVRRLAAQRARQRLRVISGGSRSAPTPEYDPTPEPEPTVYTGSGFPEGTTSGHALRVSLPARVVDSVAVGLPSGVQGLRFRVWPSVGAVWVVDGVRVPMVAGAWFVLPALCCLSLLFGSVSPGGGHLILLTDSPR